ncbi:hypothetical protein D3C75_791980 [compost metagenome]
MRHHKGGAALILLGGEQADRDPHQRHHQHRDHQQIATTPGGEENDVEVVIELDWHGITPREKPSPGTMQRQCHYRWLIASLGRSQEWYKIRILPLSGVLPLPLPEREPCCHQPRRTDPIPAGAQAPSPSCNLLFKSCSTCSPAGWRPWYSTSLRQAPPLSRCISSPSKGAKRMC